MTSSTATLPEQNQEAMSARGQFLDNISLALAALAGSPEERQGTIEVSTSGPTESGEGSMLIESDGILYRGADLFAPEEVWDYPRQRWAPAEAKRTAQG